jgi:hypothetical protein
MDDQIRKSELRHQARMRLGAQRSRVRLLRRRAIVISILAFALLWGVVFAQMVSGNDPVLGGTESKTVASSRKVAAQSSVTVEPTAGEESGDSESGAAAAEAQEIEAMEAEAAELEAAEVEAAEIEAAEAEVLAAEAEAVTTSPS